MKQALIAMLLEKSVQFSAEPIYTLVSGRKSRFYVNCKPTTLHPKGMYMVGHLVLDALAMPRPDGVGGLTFGADPIAVATAFASELRGCPVNAFSIRKHRKDHGIVRWVEGDLSDGQKVVIVDDVATTGGSTIKAIERAREEGLDVIQAVVLVDRQEGGLDNIRRHVPHVSAIVCRDELLASWNRKETPLTP